MTWEHCFICGCYTTEFYPTRTVGKFMCKNCKENEENNDLRGLEMSRMC